jgi:putative multiple sugar transport system permease protein
VNAVKTVLDVMKKNAMIVALAAAMILFEVWIRMAGRGSLFDPQNISNIIMQNAYVIILAIGMLLCIIGGGNIDLSVGSVVVLVGALTGTFMVTWGWNLYLCIGLALLMGALLGAWQGFWIAYIKIPAFIVTLAGMLMFRGLALIVLKGLTISPFPENYTKLFTGFVSSVFGLGNPMVVSLGAAIITCVVLVGTQVYGRIQQTKKGTTPGNLLAFVARLIAFCVLILLLGLLFGENKGIPAVFILICIIVAIYSYLTQRTVPGRHLYALGGNEKAAKLSGINTNRMVFAVYTSMGLLSAVAALVCIARFNNSSPSAGDGYELDAIASCYIGGAAAYGGSGKVSGAVIGALFMGVLNMGMSIVGIDANWQKAVKGLVLLVAIVFDVLSKRQAKAA